ncbi:hypothetical protein PMIN04_009744 [Paraphaeosphaeria minitans]
MPTRMSDQFQPLTCFTRNSWHLLPLSSPHPFAHTMRQHNNIVAATVRTDSLPTLRSRVLKIQKQRSYGRSHTNAEPEMVVPAATAFVWYSSSPTSSRLPPVGSVEDLRWLEKTFGNIEKEAAQDYDQKETQCVYIPSSTRPAHAVS